MVTDPKNDISSLQDQLAAHILYQYQCWLLYMPHGDVQIIKSDKVIKGPEDLGMGTRILLGHFFTSGTLSSSSFFT